MDQRGEPLPPADARLLDRGLMDTWTVDRVTSSRAAGRRHPRARLCRGFVRTPSRESPIVPCPTTDPRRLVRMAGSREAEERPAPRSAPRFGAPDEIAAARLTADRARSSARSTMQTFVCRCSWLSTARPTHYRRRPAGAREEAGLWAVALVTLAVAWWQRRRTAAEFHHPLCAGRSRGIRRRRVFARRRFSRSRRNACSATLPSRHPRVIRGAPETTILHEHLPDVVIRRDHDQPPLGRRLIRSAGPAFTCGEPMARSCPVALVCDTAFVRIATQVFDRRVPARAQRRLLQRVSDSPCTSRSRARRDRFCSVRIESSVTSVTWIPSEAITGMPKLPFELAFPTTTIRRRT